jgi:hypothetical protein
VAKKRKSLKTKVKARRLDIDLSGSADAHCEAVRPAIKELDRRSAESIARARHIPVTN